MNPLIFFVHVPKTAGSTVNAHLAEAMPNGKTHCESIIGKEAAFKKAAETRDWLSGHVNLFTARARLKAMTERPVRYFTCIREPTKQVMSHYNWLIEIYHRGEQFYTSHSSEIRELSLRFRESDNSDPAVIVENLKAAPHLFLNFQSRVILGHRFAWNGGLLYQQLAKYEMVSKEDRLGELIERMTGTRPSLVMSENTSRYHFDSSVFHRDELVDFLKKNNTLDNILYGLVE